MNSQNHAEEPIHLGKIGYLNVLPIYWPLEQGVVPNPFEISSGPPAELNGMMARGQLKLSAISSIEYARNPDRYYLVPDLAIGSRGPVKSVLLLSRIPIYRLNHEEIMVSSETHTSAALLRILLDQYIKMDCGFRTGDLSASLGNGDKPTAVLAIGDEALNLRGNPDYPHVLDLGEAWIEWTGHPFIFGVWAVQRDFAQSNPKDAARACALLQEAKQWGVDNIKAMAELAAENSFMSLKDMRSYFRGLVYDLGEEEREGLNLFYDRLVESGQIDKRPELIFFIA